MPDRMSRRRARTLRARALATIEALGGDLLDNSDRDDINLNVWSPPGKIWLATDCHSLTARWYTHPAQGWASLLEDLDKGLIPCDAVDCDGCAS